jgi:serine/threonine-protein kinase HipA
LTLVQDTRSAQRLLVKDMTELANRIRAAADKLAVECKEAGITHEILATVREVIEKRATHLLRITEKAGY